VTHRALIALEVWEGGPSHLWTSIEAGLEFWCTACWISGGAPKRYSRNCAVRLSFCDHHSGRQRPVGRVRRRPDPRCSLECLSPAATTACNRANVPPARPEPGEVSSNGLKQVSFVPADPPNYLSKVIDLANTDDR